MLSDPALYLHFLDRELSSAAGHTVTPELAERIIKCLLLGTTSRLYCGLSLLWEHPAAAQADADFLGVFLSQGVLDAVSDHASLDTFLTSRIGLYQHDIARYPMYALPPKGWLDVLQPTVLKEGSATPALQIKLVERAEGTLPSQERIDGELRLKVGRELQHAVIDRDGKAITYALFSERIREVRSDPMVADSVRRLISEEYCRHYMDFGSGDIVTGIPGLQAFDALSRSFPLTDLPILTILLNLAGMQAALDYPWQEISQVWEHVGDWRGSYQHREMRRAARALALIAAQQARADIVKSGGITSQFAVRSVACEFLRELQRGTELHAGPMHGSVDDFMAPIVNLWALIQRAKSDPRGRLTVETVLDSEMALECDVLLATATEVEAKAVLELTQSLTGTVPIPRPLERITPYKLGTIAGASTWLIQSQMGSGGPGGSQQTLEDAIVQLRPAAVIMVGICFGGDSGKQTIGDILVSRQLQCYDLKKVGEDHAGAPLITPRDDKVTASPGLLSRLQSAALQWDQSRVQFNLVLSGSTLVDNLDYREGLRKTFPEAIGGEMEGTGLYTAAANRRARWVVVKGICDWADGKKRYNKGKRQHLAARNAVQFVLHTLKRGGFTDSELG